jgi:hypothetical protein
MSDRMNGRAGRNHTLAPETLAKGLGWFSIGLGLAEVAAPRTMTRALGLEGQEGLVRAYGLREMATGIGILAARRKAPWLWGRVAGDALDLATLGTGLGEDNRKRSAVGLAVAAVAGVTAADLYCAQALSAQRPQRRLPVRDYSDRVGFPKPPGQMRGAARKDFETPRDMRAPAALRPYSSAPTRDESNGEERLSG